MDLLNVKSHTNRPIEGQARYFAFFLGGGAMTLNALDLSVPINRTVIWQNKK